jgi:tetratricopeptide (TPR) repeat protein
MPTVEPLTTNAMAHDKYLWGQFNLERRTAQGALDAIDNFTMSIGFDSAFAGAHAGLADAKLALPDYSTDASTSAQLAEARVSAETALRLDPDLPRALAALGLARYRSFDWDGAEDAYAQAVNIAPNEPVIRQRYAELLATLGRWEDALVHGRVAVEADPLSTSAHHTLLRIQRGRRTYGEAIRTGQQILTLNANDAQAWLDLGLLFLTEGRTVDAEKALGSFAEFEDGDVGAFRSFAATAAIHAETGSAGRVPAAMAELMDNRPVELAVLHQLVGDSVSALAVLEQAHRDRNPDLTYLTTRPELSPLNETPRFRAILAELDLQPQ